MFLRPQVSKVGVSASIFHNVEVNPLHTAVRRYKSSTDSNEEPVVNAAARGQVPRVAPPAVVSIQRLAPLPGPNLLASSCVDAWLQLQWLNYGI